MKQSAPKKITLTVFTPAYNRAELLPRLFESIKSQVHPGDPVEWLVIDDGSADDTASVLRDFANERADLVRFVRVANGGKHRAINRAAQLAYGDWVMIVDSDDRLLEGAIQNVLETITARSDDDRIGLLRGLKHFPEIVKVHRFNLEQNPCAHVAWISTQQPFDTAEVIRRTALLLHPFPDFSVERFMAEGWLWHQLNRTHLTYFINSPWVECFYQADGLSASSRRIRANSPCGAMAVYCAMLASGLPLRLRIRASINWWRYWFHATTQRKGVSFARQASVIFAPIGWLMFLRDQAVIVCRSLL